MMALACAIGSWELDADVTLDIDTNVVLELDANVVPAIFWVNVVKAIEEPLEETELESTLGEVLRIEELVGELLELKGEMGIVLEELPRVEEGLRIVLEELPRLEEGLGIVLEELPILEDRLCSEDDAVDEVLRLEEELTGSGCSCGCDCGCSCGCGRLSGPLRLAVGTTRDVWFPSNVGRTRTGFGKPEQEAAIREEILAFSRYSAELRWAPVSSSPTYDLELLAQWRCNSLAKTPRTLHRELQIDQHRIWLCRFRTPCCSKLFFLPLRLPRRWYL